MEPYIRDNMSDAAKEASIGYLNILWDSWKKVVSSNRALETEDIQNYADTLDELVIKEIGDTGKTALNFKLVDKLLNRNQQRDYLIDLVGSDEEEKSFAQVSLRDYFEITKQEEAKNKSKNKIAVVVASGSIVDGTQPPGMIGGDSTAQLLREAHEDEDVKSNCVKSRFGRWKCFCI